MGNKLAILLILLLHVTSFAQLGIRKSSVFNKAKSYGVPAWPYPLEYIQPDGSILSYYLRGDGAVHWQESVDGYPIVKNRENFFVYVLIGPYEKLTPSGTKVSSNRNMRKAAETTFLNQIKTGVPFSNEKIKELRANYLSSLKGPVSQKSFPPTGTGNLLVLLINYTDASNTYSQSQFNNQMNQDDFNGTGSFKQYYYENSYGLLTVNSIVSGWYTASKNHDYYGDNVDPNKNRARSLVREAVDLAEAAGINFSNYDNDSDGEVDGIMVIHQGLGAEMEDNTCIWSHSSELGSYEVQYDNVLISDYTISSETRPGGSMNGIGIPCHEFGHNLGLLDLYDTDYGGSGGESEALGSWDCMAGGPYNNYGNSPAHHCAYSKELLGWLTITEINSPAMITMTNVEQNQVAYKYYTPTANEYFLLENRQNTGFDSYLPGHGLLIYHVDGSYILSTSADNSINCDPAHQGFDMEEADNTESHSGGDAFPGTTGAYAFTDVSTPNSSSWAGANTNKTIINIQEVSGVISFNFMMGDPVIANVVHAPSTPTNQETVQVTA